MQCERDQQAQNVFRRVWFAQYLAALTHTLRAPLCAICFQIRWMIQVSCNPCRASQQATGKQSVAVQDCSTF